MHKQETYRENLRRCGYQRIEIFLPGDVVRTIDSLPGETRADRFQQALRKAVPAGIEPLLQALESLSPREATTGQLIALQRQARAILESIHGT